MPENALFQGYFAKVSFGGPPKENMSHDFKMAIFPKFFGAFMGQMIR